MAVLTHPIENFKDLVTELRPKRRRNGRDIRQVGEYGSNEDAKRIDLIESVCGLARGAGRDLVASDIWAVWAEIEGFDRTARLAEFPLVLEFPIALPDGRKIVTLVGPDRPVLGGDMIAAGECGANEDAKSLVYIERMCTGQDAAGVAVPLTARLLDTLDGADFDRAWGALCPFFSGNPGRPTSASGAPSSS